MKHRSLYSPEDKMLELISDNYRLIQVMSRFGIPMGFGDKTVEEACRDNSVDCKTFLTVVNFVSGLDDNGTIQETEVSLKALLHYLQQSHIYFLEFCLPAIRRKLIDGITLKDSDVSFLILKLFDEYVSEITSHMLDEEENLFKYVTELIKGDVKEKRAMTTYSEHHEDVGFKLKELKNIILKYCPPSSKTNLLNAALYDLYRCEEELLSHAHIEDRLLMPAIEKCETEFYS